MGCEFTDIDFGACGLPSNEDLQKQHREFIASIIAIDQPSDKTQSLFCLICKEANDILRVEWNNGPLRPDCDGILMDHEMFPKITFKYVVEYISDGVFTKKMFN